MRKIVVISLLTVLSLPAFGALKWPAAALDRVRKAKTLQEQVCPRDAGQLLKDMCALYKDSPGFGKALRLKLTTVDDSTVVIETGGQKAKVQRTNSSTGYVINGERIDLKDHANHGEIRKAIREALGTRGVFRLVMTDARADGPADLEGSIQQLLTLSSTADSCVLFTEFGKTCKDAVEKIQNSPSKDRMVRDTSTLRDRLERLRDNIEETVFPAQAIDHNRQICQMLLAPNDDSQIGGESRRETQACLKGLERLVGQGVKGVGEVRDLAQRVNAGSGGVVDATCDAPGCFGVPVGGRR